jgi:hypothetical protein
MLGSGGIYIGSGHYHLSREAGDSRFLLTVGIYLRIYKVWDKNVTEGKKMYL